MFRICFASSLLSLVACAAPTTHFDLQESPQPGPRAPQLRGGLDVQVYPVGVIAGALVTRDLGESDVLTFRVAQNETDRDDNGKQDNEEGGGPGLGIGWRRYSTEARTGWMKGVRLDVWDLDIDWISRPGTAMEMRGRSDVLVLQPTVEYGYAAQLSDAWRLETYAALGAEINVDTKGRDVGEGAILLLGFTLTLGF